MSEELTQNINSFTEEKLCEIIVSSRYLGILKDEAILCMQELASRRLNGSSFPFEQKIEEITATLPKINMDLKSVFKGIQSIKDII
jgi:hypothetical protein